MSYVDKEIACRECRGRFVFTAGEQEFYASKGFVSEPTRCPAQRHARKIGTTLTPGVCPNDVSAAGRIVGGSQPLYRAAPPRRERTPLVGPLPITPVVARVLRIDPGRRFLFARVDDLGFDVYVHHRLFSSMAIREGDQIVLEVEASDRGPRARSLHVEA